MARLGTSAKRPEGTGSKNTSQLSELSLELAAEEQYKLINEWLYVSSLPILFTLENVSLWSNNGKNMRLKVGVGFLILTETYQKGVTVQSAASCQWTSRQDSSEPGFLLSFLSQHLY